MNFKSIVFACVTLSLVSGIKAESKDNVKTRFAQTIEFVQSEKAARSAKIVVGGITTLGGCFYLPKAIGNKKTSRFETTRGVTFLTSTIISGYYMLNDGLNNKLNDALKNLVQKVKIQLPEPINEFEEVLKLD